MKKSAKIICIITAVILAFTGLCAGYIGNYYHAEGVEEYMQSYNRVTVSKIENGYFFDGPRADKAIIFYPGAKVEESAYAPVMHKLAENGFDCFVMKMPARLAIFGKSSADDIIERCSYDNYYLAGHSLGGAMAADYSADNADKVSGVILLAAYGTKDMSDASFPVISIYGSNDLVLNKEKLEKCRSNMPKRYSEICIDGGNHAYFGSYGEQKGDGKAEITNEEQWDNTAQLIINSIDNAAVGITSDEKVLSSF